MRGLNDTSPVEEWLRQFAPTSVRSALGGAPAPQRAVSAPAASNPYANVSWDELRASERGPSRTERVGEAIGDFFTENPVGQGLFGLLRTVDIPRAAINATINTGRQTGGGGFTGIPAAYARLLTDSGARDQFRSDFNRRIGFREASGIDDLPLPGVVKGTLGFIGDVATDPLTWTGVAPAARAVGVGASKLGGVGAGAARPLGEALRGGRRVDIARATAQQARTVAAEGGRVLDGDAARIVDALVSEAGRRGTGAFTRRGLARASEQAGQVIDPQVIQELFDTSVRFGYGFRRPGAQMGGDRIFLNRVGEIRADAFGSLKNVTNNLPGTSAFRQGFNSAEFKYNQLVDDILRGGEGSYERALTLGAVHDARAVARVWLNDQVIRQKRDFGERSTWLDRGGTTLSKKDNDTVLTLLEQGLVDPNFTFPSGSLGDFARQLRDEFNFLRENAMETAPNLEVAFRAGYVPHRLTPEGQRLAETLEETLISSWGINTRAAFQEARQLQAGRTMTLPSGRQVQLQTGSIREINEYIAQDLGKPDFKFFNDDVLDVLGGYTNEVANQIQRRVFMNNLRHIYPEAVTDMQQLPTGTVSAGTRAARAQQKKLISQARDEELDAIARATNARIEAAEQFLDGVGARSKDHVEALRQHDRAMEEIAKNQQIMDDLKEVARQATVNRRETAASIRQMRRNYKEQQKAYKEEIARLEAQVERIRAGYATKQISDEDWMALLSQYQMRVDRAKLLQERNNRLLRELDTPPKTKTGDGESVADVMMRRARNQEDLAKARLRGSEWYAAVDAKKAAGRRLLYTDQTSVEEYRAMAATVGEVLDRVEAALRVQTGRRARKRDVEGRTSARRPAEVESLIEQHRVLREEWEQLARTFDDPAVAQVFDGDPFMDLMRRMELQAKELDAEALEATVRRVDAEATLKALDDQAFRETMVFHLDEGFAKFSATEQIDQNILKMFEQEINQYKTILGAWGKTAGVSPEALVQVQRARDGIKSFMNWWKGWAVGSPGFVSRNIQGGVSNMIIGDGVSPTSIKIFLDAYRFYARGNVGGETWQQRAAASLKNNRTVRKEAAIRGVDAEQFAMELVNGPIEESIRVAAATGWGQAATEVRGVGATKARSWSPARADNRFTGSVRAMASHSEAVMRGSHAFDVMRKGGDFDTAVARVTKWHFNYQDIGGIDRAMKGIIPFWSFYSRNLPLQAQLWTQAPQRVNRTYANAVRNFSDVDENGQLEPRPQWIREAGMIQTGLRVGGQRVNVGLDLPMLRLQQDIQQGMPPWRLLNDAYPWFKLPVEEMVGKSLFYNADFRDEYTEKFVGKSGEMQIRPREAPIFFNNPVLRPLLDLLPGFKDIDGTLAVTDRMENRYRQLPPLQRASSLGGMTDRERDKLLPRLVSFTSGVQFRPNDPRQQQFQQRREVFEQILEVRRARQIEAAGSWSKGD